MTQWIAAENARIGLRYAVVCPNVMGKTKERIIQSKRVHTGLLAIVDYPKVARICILRTFFWLQMLCILFLALRLFCFCFVFTFSFH